MFNTYKNEGYQISGKYLFMVTRHAAPVSPHIVEADNNVFLYSRSVSKTIVRLI